MRLERLVVEDLFPSACVLHKSSEFDTPGEMTRTTRPPTRPGSKIRHIWPRI